MQGIELSEKYYNEYFQGLIEKFPDLENRVAVGIAGSGSECLGFDDENSRDHDFGIGFTMWLTSEDEEKYGFKLMREYQKLPKDFMGFSKSKESYGYKNKFGVISVDDFYKDIIGFSDMEENPLRFVFVGEHHFLKATNGKVFQDKLGEFSKIRNFLKNDFPKDVWLKKLSAHLILSAQAGQYNYPRMVGRCDYVGAQLAVNEYVNHMLFVMHELSNEFTPYYKWRMKSLEKLAGFKDFYSDFKFLLTTDNMGQNGKRKIDIIENIGYNIKEKLRELSLSNLNSNFLEPHAFEVQKHIKNREIASLHIMESGE